MSYSTSTTTSSTPAFTTTPALTATPAITYKQLQAKLKELKAAGHDVHCKLNSKHEVLLAEFNRLTAVLEVEVQQALDGQTVLEPQVDIEPQVELAPQSSSTSSSYPFTSNTVKVSNTARVPNAARVQDVYHTRTLPALNSKYAPSWLAKPQKVYIIDGVDYLPHELEQALQGQTCELTCDVMNYQQTELSCDVDAAPLAGQSCTLEIPASTVVTLQPAPVPSFFRVYVFPILIPFIHAFLVTAVAVKSFLEGLEEGARSVPMPDASKPRSVSQPASTTTRYGTATGCCTDTRDCTAAYPNKPVEGVERLER